MNPAPVKPLDPLAVLSTLALKAINHFHPIKDTPAARINAVMQATGLTNRNGESPELIENKPTDTGHTLTYRLPPGIIPADFKERRQHFDTYGSFMSDYYNDGTPVLTIHTHTESFPEMIPYKYTYTTGIAPLPLGKSASGKDYTLQLPDLPHLLLGGMTRYGKTSLLLSLSVSLRKAGCTVYAIDHKKLDFPILSDYLHVSTNEKTTLSLIQSLQTEMSRRLDLFSGHYQKFQDYPGNDLPYIVVIVDELQTITSKATQEAINELARIGAAPGISLILSTQKPSSKVWEGFTDTRDLCTGRISFYVSDYFMSQAILGKGNTRAAALPAKKGRAVVSVGDDETIIQTMYIDAKTALKELEPLGKVAPIHEQDPLWTPTETTDPSSNTENWTPDNAPDHSNLLPDKKRPKKSAASPKTNGARKTAKTNQGTKRTKLSVLPNETPAAN